MRNIPGKLLFFVLFAILFIGCKNTEKDTRLDKSSREDKNGWIYVHLEGSPATIGYQHGYLLANDIDTTIQAISHLLTHETKKDWAFYRGCARNFLWNELDREYKDEINGIVEGLQAQHKNYDSLDITALNAMEELAYYY